MRTKAIKVVLLLIFGLFSCSDESNDFELMGKWIDTESLGLQFIEFHSEKQGRFGLYSKNSVRYEKFSYKIFDNKIAIDFEGDEVGETIHDILFVGKDRIEISGLTAIPENPTKKYLRKNIKTEKLNNEIVLGINDIYFDFEDGFQLQAYPIEDSRCPIGAQCFWAGFASARFDLIVNGNHEVTFDLSTIDMLPYYKVDTLINGITYRLKDIIPYPDLKKQYEISHYKVIVTVDK